MYDCIFLWWSGRSEKQHRQPQKRTSPHSQLGMRASSAHSYYLTSFGQPHLSTDFCVHPSFPFAFFSRYNFSGSVFSFVTWNSSFFRLPTLTFYCLPLDCFLLTLCELNSFFPILGCLSDRNAWFSWMSHTGFCYPRIGSALYIGLTLSFSDYNVPQYPTFVNPILDKISIFFIALTKRGRSAVPAADPHQQEIPPWRMPLKQRISAKPLWEAEFWPDKQN